MLWLGCIYLAGCLILLLCCSEGAGGVAFAWYRLHLSFCCIYFFLSYVLHARPARPVWIISPVSRSSDRKTGQPWPSALTRLNSSFVPIILNVLACVSMAANNGICVRYRLWSNVCRSSSIVVGDENSTVEVVLSIFLRYSEAMTAVPVW